MSNLFEHNSASWVRYSDYEWRTAADGNLYLLPAKDATPKPYDPMKDVETLVLDAVTVGLHFMERRPDKEMQPELLAFAKKYGLLGIMTALPTTAEFVDYEKVYLPKNQMIREEVLETTDYLQLFFPFEKQDFHKKGMEYLWNIDAHYDQALALTYSGYPLATVMSFMHGYGERFDWLKRVFKDLAFNLLTVKYCLEEKGNDDLDTMRVLQKGLKAFDENAPTFHIEVIDQPTIVWDFHSLQLCVKMMLFQALTDSSRPLRVCKSCGKAFYAHRREQDFCSAKCRHEFENGQK